MAKLPEDFPGRAALEAAGITTYAQVRKAQKDELTAIPGVGEVTAGKIEEAMAAETPAEQFERDDVSETEPITVASDGPRPAKPLPEEQARDEGSRLANSRLVVSDLPSGYEVSLPEHYKDDQSGRRKVLPLTSSKPMRGMTIYDPDGEVYTISEEMEGDWFRVKSPTGVALVR